MKKAICIAVISICLLIVLSVLAKEGIERKMWKPFSEHENRAQIVREWTGPGILKEKSEVLVPEIEGSKEEVAAGLIENNIKKADGVKKQRYRDENMELQKIQIYHPAFEMARIEAMKQNVRQKIAKAEDKSRVQDLKDEFYLDFLNLKLENAKIAGNESEIDEIKSAIQNFEQYLNTQEKSKE